MANTNYSKSLEEIIKSRRSIRKFSKGPLPLKEVNEILKSAIYAPYAAAATGLAVTEARKVFVIKTGTGTMEVIKKILFSEVASLGKKINLALKIFPFLKNKVGPFSNKLNEIVKNGIPSLDNGYYFIIVAERMGFPLNVKQSLAHAMQNMWLTATNYNIGFQLLSIIGILSKNQKLLKLLKLPANKYQLDGCIIGVPEDTPEAKKDIEIDEFVTWIT